MDNNPSTEDDLVGSEIRKSGVHGLHHPTAILQFNNPLGTGSSGERFGINVWGLRNNQPRMLTCCFSAARSRAGGSAPAGILAGRRARQQVQPAILQCLPTGVRYGRRGVPDDAAPAAGDADGQHRGGAGVQRGCRLARQGDLWISGIKESLGLLTVQRGALQDIAY